MVKLSSRAAMLGVVVMFILTTAVGCRAIYKGISEAFGGETRIDPTMAAIYSDGKPRIGPGMTLNIVVSSVTTKPVQMEVIVDQQGALTLQHLIEEPVACNGLTLDELKSRLINEYSKFYRQPQITVTFGKYDAHGVSPWGSVRVMGEVGNPGPVNMPPTMDLTVTKVLQLAGGVKQFGDKTRVRVTRCDKNGRQTVTIVDLEEIGEDGRFDKDMLLRAGDVVYVPQTWY